LPEDLCPSCGNPLSSEACPQCAERQVFKVIRRDISLLALLTGVAILTFLGTRQLAAVNRNFNQRMAADEYRKGEQKLQAGNIHAAVDSFRSAAVRDQQRPEYLLALAGALTLDSRNAEAIQVLQTLRDSNPQDARVNLVLARATAGTGNVTDAIKYYQNALYGDWPEGESLQQRIPVRLEFIHYLMDHARQELAISELVALVYNLPGRDPTHLDAGSLFLKLNDPSRALEQFKQALRNQPGDPDALAGAGRAAFMLGDYENAKIYLQAAGSTSAQQSDVASLLKRTDMILENDPMAAHLSSSERETRLRQNLDYATAQLRICGNVNHENVANLLQEGEAIKTQSQKAHTRSDIDMLRNGIELTYEMEQVTRSACRLTDDLGDALIRIGLRHRAAAR